VPERLRMVWRESKMC